MNIGLPFDPSAMVRFRKRLTLERLEAINEQIIRKMEAKRKAEEDHQNDDKPNHLPIKEHSSCSAYSGRW